MRRPTVAGGALKICQEWRRMLYLSSGGVLNRAVISGALPGRSADGDRLRGVFVDDLRRGGPAGPEVGRQGQQRGGGADGSGGGERPAGPGTVDDQPGERRPERVADRQRGAEQADRLAAR